MLYILAVSLGLILAWIAAGRSATIVVGLMAGFVALSLVGFAEISGTPKRSQLEWRELREVPVLAWALDEPRAIYLWLALNEPTSYHLPWSEKRAREILAAAADAKAGGGRLLMRHLDMAPDDAARVFHAAPPESLPPKIAQ